MQPDILRKRTWEEMLNAEMRSGYFAELVRHYLLIDRALRVSGLLASAGAIATALASVGTEVRIIAPILATFVNFWLLISQYGLMSRDASDLHSGWGSVARDYERIWNNLDAPDANEQFYKTYERAEALSKSGEKFPNKKRRLNFWLDHAASIATARYA